MHTSCIVYLIASYSYMQHYCYCCYPFLPVIGTGEHTQKAQPAGGKIACTEPIETKTSLANAGEVHGTINTERKNPVAIVYQL